LDWAKGAVEPPRAIRIGTQGALAGYSSGWHNNSGGLKPTGFRFCCNRESAVNSWIVGRMRLIAIREVNLP